MRKKLHILFTLGLLFLKYEAFTQFFPVQTSFLLKPPYSVYLSEYANPLGTQLNMKVLLRDLRLGATQVYFRFTISSSGVNYANQLNSVGKPIFTLSPGVSQTFTQAELAPYFTAQNLGLPPKSYANILPEGNYTLTVEVIDFLTNKALSKIEQTTLWLVVNEPPILNLPANNSVLKSKNLQNILFQWTPRHRQASTVEYEFTLTELLVNDNFSGNLQNLFLAQPAYYQTKTSQTSLLYGPGSPPLVEGRTYGFRVRAYAKQGFNEVGVFSNNGYSEIFFFKYGENNTPPKLYSAQWTKDGLIELIWEKKPVHVKFDIRQTVYNEFSGKGTVEALPIISVDAVNVNSTFNTYSMKVAGNFFSVYSFDVGGIHKSPTQKTLYSNVIEVQAVRSANFLNIEAVKKDENDYISALTGKSKKKSPTPLVPTCDKPTVDPTDFTTNSIIKGDILYVAGNQAEVIDNETASISMMLPATSNPLKVKVYYSQDFSINQYNEVVKGYLSSTPTNHKIELLNSSSEASVSVDKSLSANIINIGFKVDSIRLLGNQKFDNTVQLISTLYRSPSVNSVKLRVSQLLALLKTKDNYFQQTFLELNNLVANSNTDEQKLTLNNLKNKLTNQQQENNKNISILEQFEKNFATVDRNTYSGLVTRLYGIK